MKEGWIADWHLQLRVSRHLLQCMVPGWKEVHEVVVVVGSTAESWLLKDPYGLLSSSSCHILTQVGNLEIKPHQAEVGRRSGPCQC